MNQDRERLSLAEREEQYRSIFDAAGDGLIICDLESGLVVEANPTACALHGCARPEFIGLGPTAFIHADSRGAFDEFVRGVQSGKGFEALVLHLRRDGSTFHAEWRGMAFTYQGRPCLLGAIRDVSKRIQAEQVLHQRAEAHTREQSALLQISHTLASTLELQPGLVLEQLRVIISYTHAALFGLEVADSTLVALAVRGPLEMEQAAQFRIGLSTPEALASMFKARRPIRIADVAAADPDAEFLRSVLNHEAALLLEGVRSWMWVPLAVERRIVGAIGVAHSEPDYFTVHHADLALAMANQVALAMVNSELYEHARVLAALEERQRLAQNLHDAVNQSLFSAGLIAEVLPRLWDRDQAAARESLEDLRRLTRGALAEMRELLAELRPSVLTDSSLGDLLRQLANAFTGRTNIPVNLTITGQHALTADVQVALYRICQEALNNIAKHAGAGRVDIHLQYQADTVELRVRDDGKGFDADGPVSSGHYGLGMMRERAESARGQMTVSSRPGQGTEIVLRWQVVPQQEAP